MEPMLLSPVGKDYLWGGTRLKSEYGKKIALEPLAETWECSTHPDGPSVIVNGQFKGKMLPDVLNDHPEYLGSKSSSNRELQILVKFIDAAKDLSVQVHPDDIYARANEKQNGKTEMWYVLDAAPNARLVHGFEHTMTKELLLNASQSGDLSKHLHYVPVHQGDSFYIPAGTIHAIGSGIVVAEIQESSNVTYRIYDYDRIGKDGKKRELHLMKALDVLDLSVSKNVRQKPRIIRYIPGSSSELICRCEYFEVERIFVQDYFTFSVERESFQVLLCLQGSGTIRLGNKKDSLSFYKGDCLFLPARLGACKIDGSTAMLKIRC